MEKINIEFGDFGFLGNINKQIWLENNKEYFTEWSTNELESSISNICLAKSPAERMEGRNELRKLSIGNYYHNLKGKLLSTQTLDFAHLLPPSRQGLHQFFGFASNHNAVTNIEKANKSICKRSDHKIWVIFCNIKNVGLPTYCIYLILKLTKSKNYQRTNERKFYQNFLMFLLLLSVGCIFLI